MKILIVEDEIKLAHMLAQGFAGKGHTVDIVTSGREAQRQTSRVYSDYNVIILDLEVPGADMYATCRKIRDRNRSIPILAFSSEHAAQGEKNLLLRSGADSFLFKPFSFEELSVKVEKLSKGRLRDALPTILSAQHLTLDPKERSATRDGEPIALTDKEFDLLEYFMRNGNRVINREELLTQLWDYNYTSFFSNVLDVHIKNLRRKIDHGNSQSVLETIRGVGYRIRL
jgi:two-component system OmpR family response regulator